MNHLSDGADNALLEWLLKRTITPPGHSGSQRFGGGQTVKQAATLKLHVNSMGWGTKVMGASRVVAWVLVVDPGVREGIDPHALAVAMGETRAESRAAAMPTEGGSVQDIAMGVG